MISFTHSFVLLILCLSVSCGKENSDKNKDKLSAPKASLDWLTHFGQTTGPGDRSGSDWCQDLTVSSTGDIYCAGNTSSSLGESSGGQNDAFVAKLNPQGELIWLTQLGAESTDNAGENDGCLAIAVNANDEVFCGGSTTGNLGGTNAGASDAFVAKFSTDGTLLWITQIEGNLSEVSADKEDSCLSIDVDNEGNVYCAGATSSDLGEKSGGDEDGFIVKLDSEGQQIWMTQLGEDTLGTKSGQSDICNGLSVDKDQNTYCGGQTKGELGEEHGGGVTDAFVAKLNKDGVLQWVKQLGATSAGTGSSRDDTCLAIATDGEDGVYCSGETSGSLADDEPQDNMDEFVWKLDSSSESVWLSQLGSSDNLGDTSSNETFGRIAVDPSKNVFIGGETWSSLVEPQGTNVSGDPLIVKFDPEGVISWVFQLGEVSDPGANDGRSYCLGIGVDSSGGVYCGGVTFSSSLGEKTAGFTDFFVMKVNPPQ